MSKVKTSEILDLLKLHKFEDIKSTLKDIDTVISTTGDTTLMYATAYKDEEAIKFLMNNGANPFKEDNYGNSAFSIAFRQGMEDIAKDFVLSMGSYDKLAKDYNGLVIALLDQVKGDFGYYIASHICTKDASLRDLFGFDTDGAKSCFTHAKDYYEFLGEDGTSLLGAYELS